MISFLLKIITVAALVQFSLSAVMQGVACPDDVEINDVYYPEEGCMVCNCTGGLDFSTMPPNVIKVGPCYSCGAVYIENCSETEQVNPDANYPGCCERRCKT